VRRGALAPRVGALVVAGTLAAIAFATLVPMGRHTAAFNWCFACAPRASADAVMNVALFVPLGIGLRLLGCSAWLAALTGVLLTVGIEVAQTVVPGRDPAVSDLVANSGGTLLGAVIAGWSWMLHLSPAAAGRLALAAAAAGVALTFGAGFLIAPSFPPRDYWSQWTPELASMPAYPGSLLSARVGGVDLPPGPVADAAGLRARLAAGAPIELALRAGEPPPMESTLFSVAQVDRNRPLVIGASGDDLFLRYRTRSVDFRFSQPDLWADGLLADIAPGEAFTLTVRRDGERICVAAGDRRRCDLAYSPGDAWMLLISTGLPPHALRPAVQIGWLALLALPVGFWWRPGLTGAVAAATLPLGALLAAPALTMLAPAGPRQWFALAGGGLIGLVAARLAGSRWAWPVGEPAVGASPAAVPRSATHP
jgi:VanZ like family